MRRPATLMHEGDPAPEGPGRTPLDAYDERRMAEEVTREELVRCLAEVSHKSWIKQKVRDYGAVESDLSTGFTSTISNVPRTPCRSSSGSTSGRDED